MQTYNIATGSITYAIKGRDVLRNKGFKANIERRSPDLKSAGCGYSVVAVGDIGRIEAVLKDAGGKILSIEPR